MCQLCLSHLYCLFQKVSVSIDFRQKAEFARGTLMISDILCYFHAASFLGSVLQLFPAQLEFRPSLWSAQKLYLGEYFNIFKMHFISEV